jgi:hypothetical protein
VEGGIYLKPLKTGANIGIAKSGAGRKSNGQRSSSQHQLWCDRFSKRDQFKEINQFSKQVWWLGGRFSNTPPSAIPGRCTQAVESALIN